MPLTLTLTEGVLPKGSEKKAIAQLTDSLLKWSGLEGNKLMTSNVTANVIIVPKGSSFSGGQAFSGAWVEWKLPSFGLADRAVQKGYFAEATNIIHELSGKKQPKNNIYVNVLHAVDGAWNFEGEAMTNAEIVAAISAA